MNRISPVSAATAQARFAARTPDVGPLRLEKEQSAGFPYMVVKGQGRAEEIQPQLDKLPSDMRVSMQGHVTGKLKYHGPMAIVLGGIADDVEADGMVTVGRGSRAKSLKGGSADIWGEVDGPVVSSGTIHVRRGARARSVEGTDWYMVKVHRGGVVSDSAVSGGELSLNGTHVKTAQAKTGIHLDNGAIVEGLAEARNGHLFLSADSQAGSLKGHTISVLGRVKDDVTLAGDGAFLRFQERNPIRLSPASNTKGLTLSVDHEKQPLKADDVWAAIAPAGTKPVGMTFYSHQRYKPGYN